MCDTLKRIDKARWWMLNKQPFYGSLAMALADVIDPTISTACTDGRVIRWNPEFVAGLDDPELRFALLHETLHCAHGHMWRLPTDQTGNAAGDYAINITIADIDGISMPEGLLCDKKYAGMSEEEIYAKLSAQQPPKQDSGDDDDEDGQPSGGGSGGQSGGGGKKKPKPNSKPDNGSGDDKSDDGDDGDGHGDNSNPCSHFAPSKNPDADQAQQAVEDAALRDEWEQRVIQAAQAAQASGVGDIPGDMERLLERMRHQEVDWKREMTDFVKNAVATRNDWSRAARRHAWQSVIYPRRIVDSVGTVVFVRDTSGSINDTVCGQFTALINDCVSEMNCEGVVIDCDMTLKAEYRISPGDECPAVAKGGGGTDLRPPFDRAAELEAAGEQIAGIVYLTDLDAGNRVPAESDIPTLWLVTPVYGDRYKDDAAPFGRTVRVETVSR